MLPRPAAIPFNHRQNLRSRRLRHRRILLDVLGPPSLPLKDRGRAQLVAHGEDREGCEGKPEAASAQARGCRPQEPELAPKAQEEQPRPARAPRPADDQPDHHCHPDRHRTEEDVDQGFRHRRLLHQIHEIGVQIPHLFVLFSDFASPLDRIKYQTERTRKRKR